MAKYSVAVAKNTLPRLIDKARDGEEVVITRHGKPVAELRATLPSCVRAASGAYDRLRAARDAGPTISFTSVELLNAMYEEGND